MNNQPRRFYKALMIWCLVIGPLLAGSLPVSRVGYPVKSAATLYAPITFTFDPASSCFTALRPKFPQIADSALKIAAKVLNSQEFRDSIAKYTFPCENYSNACAAKCGDCANGKISAGAVFDSLYRARRAPIKLVLNNDGSCRGGSFGFSYENKFTITSHYKTIVCDDTLSFAHKYAYHICHEYMHIVGFYHFQNPNVRVRDWDVAEKTGWIAYDILTRWRKNGIPTL